MLSKKEFDVIREFLGDAPMTVESAVKFLLLLEKSGIMDAVSEAKDLLCMAAGGREETYTDDLGTIKVAAPYDTTLDVARFSKEKPGLYRVLLEKKQSKVKLALSDLPKEDAKEYGIQHECKAKVRVSLA